MLLPMLVLPLVQLLSLVFLLLHVLYPRVLLCCPRTQTDRLNLLGLLL
jgi:hypothetical protein